jgi:hypothetical protein
METQCAQQPVERDVVTTEYRTEPIVETVPATVVENVVVDEGSFQTVWVPRMTTKAVARTTYQSRTSYRTVPYQVARRVSEFGSQTVQTVRGTTTGGALAYGTTSGYGSTALAPAYGPTLAGSYPTLAGSPTYPTPITTAGSAGLVPGARYADAPATPISPRSASSAPRYSDRRTADRGSLFVPAPSAAQVWQTQRDSVVR